MKNIQVLRGGKGDHSDKKSLNQKELEVGKTVESEHTSNSKIADEIATDHVTEDPSYYSKLIKADLVDEPKALKKARQLNVERVIKECPNESFYGNVAFGGSPKFTFVIFDNLDWAFSINEGSLIVYSENKKKKRVKCDEDGWMHGEIMEKLRRDDSFVYGRFWPNDMVLAIRGYNDDKVGAEGRKAVEQFLIESKIIPSKYSKVHFDNGLFENEVENYDGENFINWRNLSSFKPSDHSSLRSKIYSDLGIYESTKSIKSQLLEQNLINVERVIKESPNYSLFNFSWENKNIIFLIYNDGDWAYQTNGSLVYKINGKIKKITPYWRGVTTHCKIHSNILQEEQIDMKNPEWDKKWSEAINGRLWHHNPYPVLSTRKGDDCFNDYKTMEKLSHNDKISLIKFLSETNLISSQKIYFDNAFTSAELEGRDPESFVVNWKNLKTSGETNTNWLRSRLYAKSGVFESTKSIKTQLLEQNLINEELTRSDIELVKRLILSAFEGWLQNLFTRRSLTLTGINWKESRDKNGNLIKEALKPSGLKNIQNARHLGGAFDKYTGQTDDGKFKLLKPHRDPFRAHADYAASKIGKHINQETPSVNVVEYEGMAASEQDLVDVDNNFKINKWSDESISKLSQQDINSIVHDSVLNWMLGNHDAHAAQFIRSKSGNIIGIDKTQSFKHYGRDKLSLDFNPNSDFDEDQPYIYYILQAWKNGRIEIDPKQFGIAIKKIQAIPDNDIIKWIIPYAKQVAIAFKGGDRNWIKEFVGMVIARKHNLFKDYIQFLSNLLKKEVQLESILKR